MGLIGTRQRGLARWKSTAVVAVVMLLATLFSLVGAPVSNAQGGEPVPTVTVFTAAEFEAALDTVPELRTDLIISLGGDITSAQSVLIVDAGSSRLTIEGNGYALTGGFAGGLPVLGTNGAQFDSIVEIRNLQLVNWEVVVFDGSTFVNASTVPSLEVQDGDLVVLNSTVDGNVFLSDGGADEILIFSSTIAGNLRTIGPTVGIGSSIVEGSCDGDGGFDDFGFNFSGGSGCDGFAPLAEGSLASELAPNGCTAPCTPTLELLARSNAVGGGDCTIALVNTDQRGVARKSPCDAGSFETTTPATSGLQPGVVMLQNASNDRYLDADGRHSGFNVDTNRRALPDTAWDLTAVSYTHLTLPTTPYV